MTEFLLCFFLGPFGAHKFYKRDTKMGIIYLCTAGLFGLGWMYDIVKLGIGLIKGKHTGAIEHYTGEIEQEQNSEFSNREIRKQARKEAKAKALEEKRLAIAREKERIAQLDREGIVYCPKCKSTSVQYVERRKQLSLTRAAVGTVLLNPLAGAVGAVTSKKRKGFNKCLKCGYSWKI